MITEINTVADLISVLQELDQDAKVALQGRLGGTLAPISEVILDDFFVAPNDRTYATHGRMMDGVHSKMNLKQEGKVVVLW